MSETRYAVLIGINDYEKSPLRYCTNDVTELKKRLINNCLYANDNIFEIVSTKDTPVSDVYAAFIQSIDSIKQRFVEKTDNILFYFSGHGKFEGGSTHLEFHDNLVSTQTIYEQLSALAPANQVYILDACHSGFGIEFKSGDAAAMQEYYQQRYIATSDGFFFLCSCKQDERSQAFPEYRNGVFTKYILDAIDNSSIYDSENDCLTLPVIHEYALKKILLTSKYSQTPFIQMQASGYYPFAVRKPEDSQFCESVVETFNSDAGIENFFRREDLNLSPNLRRDLFHFCSELILNLFEHSFAPEVQISIMGNTISIYDYSEKPFNPFAAQPTTDGVGVKIINAFMDRYKDVCTYIYEEGVPNTTTLAFSTEVGDFKYDAPCFIAIENESLSRPTSLNSIKIDKNCKQLVIDATNAFVWGSMSGLFMDYLIQRTEDTKPLIILKLNKNDFTIEHLIPMTKVDPYTRIMIV